MSIRCWFVALVWLSVATTSAIAQTGAASMTPEEAARAKEGAALADQAERLINQGDSNAPQAMALAEKGAALGDAKSHVGIAYIYWKTGVKPKDFPGYVDRFLRMHEGLPIDDPLTGENLLMQGIVKNGDTATVEALLGKRVQAGDTDGMFHLAMLRLVEKNASGSMEMLDQSAAGGNVRAARMIQVLKAAATKALQERK